jgi:hypothetical protein
LRPEPVSGKKPFYNFCTEFFKTTQVSGGTFQAIKDKIGERGIIEVIGSASEYEMQPLELTQKPGLAPLAKRLP